MAVMSVRKAALSDLGILVDFTAQEAIEVEGSVNVPETLSKGIKSALLDPYKVTVELKKQQAKEGFALEHLLF
ncbi:MAG: hypothetical protein OQJ89_16230 [Kangiellaceae bacterium]|nr:hypothetical protein [Kangiellaceae bacterium]MCW8998162.1 hypothetical protein [Kangiellaceae bacterium]MCW9018522.1 hypothetical protein [Kangiellaceae bacterium]